MSEELDYEIVIDAEQLRPGLIAYHASLKTHPGCGMPGVSPEDAVRVLREFLPFYIEWCEQNGVEPPQKVPVLRTVNVHQISKSEASQ